MIATGPRDSDMGICRRTPGTPHTPAVGRRGSTLSLRRCGLSGLFALLFLGLQLCWASPALAPPPPFPDVPVWHPFHDAILDLASRGIILGYGDGDFGPGDPVTRQQSAKMIVLTGGYSVSESNVCPFWDVEVSGPGSLYPDNYVAVAVAHGITMGTSETTYSPYDDISRYQVISMVVRAANDLQPGLLKAPPAGWTGTGSWGDNATHGPNARKAEYNDLLGGLPLDIFDPWGSMTRGEVAQVLHNLLAKLTAGDDLLHFWSTNATDWQIENVSELTGERIAGPVTAYELSEFDSVEHLATISPSSDLLVFSETVLSHNWQVVNVGQLTGEKVAGSVTSWRSGTSTATTADDADHLAATNISGDLVHFWWTPQSDWQVENVSLIVGGAKIAGPPTSWHVIPNASDVDHLAAMAPDGDLLVFWGAPLGHKWQMVNVTQTSGQKIAGPPVYWLYAEQGGAWADNLAAVGANGELLHFRWSLQADWTAHPIAPWSGYTLSGSLTCWTVATQGTFVAHLAGTSGQGDLLHYWAAPAGWQMENVSQIAGGAKIAGPATDWFTGWPPSGSSWINRLAAVDPAHSLLVFRDGQPGWQVVNVTEKTGQKVGDPVTGWLTGGVSASAVEHLAALKRD